LDLIGIHNKKIELTEKQNLIINKKVREFCNSMSSANQSASYYEENRQTSFNKAKLDIMLGKKAEYFVMWSLFKFWNFPEIQIDTEIRSGRQKGWAVDLPYSHYDDTLPNIHVKACSAGTYKFCGDYSWTFQYWDENRGKDDIFNQNHNDLVAFIYLDDYQNAEATIIGILDWNTISKYLKDPIKHSLKGYKKCLYYEDIKI
jgi:hypothetical protein